MLAEKKMLSLEDLAAEVALELPSRETLALVVVNLTNVLNNNTVQVPIAIAANICGVAVNVLAAELQNGPVTCTTGAQTFNVTG